MKPGMRLPRRARHGHARLDAGQGVSPLVVAIAAPLSAVRLPPRHDRVRRARGASGEQHASEHVAMLW
jgi:hypothetical protein